MQVEGRAEPVLALENLKPQLVAEIPAEVDLTSLSAQKRGVAVFQTQAQCTDGWRGLDRNTKHPAIVVGHPMGAVKEQSANLYAQKLAEQGFVTLSLDLSFWGESDGQPRNAVSPDIYAEDFSAAVDFLELDRLSTRSALECSGFAEAVASS